MSKREWTPPNDEDTVRLLRTMPLPEHLGGGLCKHAAGRIDSLRSEVLQYGNTMGRIAIALFGDRNNRTDEECVAQATEVVRERDSLRQHLHDEHRRHVETMDERDALRGALLELRIRLHVSGRRPEECYEMSIIDAALVAARKEGEG